MFAKARQDIGPLERLPGNCRSCHSANLKSFSAEMGIHFPGPLFQHGARREILHIIRQNFVVASNGLHVIRSVYGGPNVAVSAPKESQKRDSETDVKCYPESGSYTRHDSCIQVLGLQSFFGQGKCKLYQPRPIIKSAAAPRMFHPTLVLTSITIYGVMLLMALSPLTFALEISIPSGRYS